MEADSQTASGTQHAEAPEGLLTKFEIAERLKIAPRTLEIWRQKGRIPFFKIGKSCRYRWNDVIEKLQSFRVN
jgi:predicted site-specific integrase-resolvase